MSSSRTPELDGAIRVALPELAAARFAWRSPLGEDHYAEYWDATFLRRLNLDNRFAGLNTPAERS